MFSGQCPVVNEMMICYHISKLTIERAPRDFQVLVSTSSCCGAFRLERIPHATKLSPMSALHSIKGCRIFIGKSSLVHHHLILQRHIRKTRSDDTLKLNHPSSAFTAKKTLPPENESLIRLCCHNDQSTEERRKLVCARFSILREVTKKLLDLIPQTFSGWHRMMHHTSSVPCDI